MKSFNFLGGAALGVCLLASVPANASPVTITLSESGYTNFVGTTPDFVNFNGSFGTFNINSITAADSTALGSPSDLLKTTSLNVSTTAAGTLTIDVLAQNVGPANVAFLSGFTTNNLPTDWTVTETSYINGTQIGTAAFTGIGSQTQTTPLFMLNPGPTFNVEEKFVIHAAPGGGSDLSTIDVATAAPGRTSSVPEPATWAMMIAGFLGVGLLGYRRRSSGLRLA